MRPVSVLLVDVPPGHAGQLEQALAEAGRPARAEPVRGADALTTALQRRGWDVVLYGGEGEGAVPARKALALVRLADPHLPFLAVSRLVRPGDLATVVRGLPAAVPVVPDPGRLPAVLERELDRARLRRRVGGAHRLLLAQQAITDHVAAGLAPDTLCARSVATLGETLGWSYGAAWRPDGARLRTAAVWHAPGGPREVAQFAAAARDVTVAPGQGLAGRVWAFRRPAWVADVAGERDMPRAAAAVRAGLMSAVAFPLAAGEECAGVIELYAHGVREPNAEIAAMLATVGRQLAHALVRRRAEPLDESPALLVALDARGRVELASRATCALLGVEEAALLGRDWFEAAVPCDDARAGARATFRRLLASGGEGTVAVAHAVGERAVAWRWTLRRRAGEPAGVLAWGEPSG